MIYKQKTAGLCGQYSCLYSLEKKGVKVTEQLILDLGFMPGFPTMRDKLMRTNLIKGAFFPLTRIQIDRKLSEGHWLPCKLIRNNFASVRNPPHINDFKGVQGHFVCLMEDLGDRWKYIDQQGPNFGDKGYGYIMKKDFKYITVCHLYE